MTAHDDARSAAEAAAKAAEVAEAQAAAARKNAEVLAAAATKAQADADAQVVEEPVVEEPVVEEPVVEETVAEETVAEETKDSEIVKIVKAGYAFDGIAIEMGALVDGDAVPEAQVRIPLAMLNRHGLVAGATGTGKTKTLQVLAEQIAANGVPVFAADIKGDLSGIATPGTPSDKLLERTKAIGQDWTPQASATEYYALGGIGLGLPVRATIDGFGPTLLSKVLGLNATQESSLGLVFHFARTKGYPMVDLADLRAVLTHLTGDEGKAELKNLGGLSGATVGVILRELIGFSDEGADMFFGQPEIVVSDFLRTTADGRGVVSLLEVPGVQDKPALFSTFLMYLLNQLFKELPEVGDSDKPKLVFFFDEAHLLFADASDDFLQTITQTVRLIRSKGVGIFFVTQTPKDVPSDILAQLGSRVQHQLRAHTPDAAKALKATVSTYPNTTYDLEEVLTALGIGEAIVTVMSDKGAPTPVAWTRLRAPQGSMDPTPADQIQAAFTSSPLMAKYGTAVNPHSASEMLGADAAATASVPAPGDVAASAERTSAQWERSEAERIAREAQEIAKQKPKSTSTRRSGRMSTVDRAVGEASRTLAREIVKNLFRKRR